MTNATTALLLSAALLAGAGSIDASAAPIASLTVSALEYAGPTTATIQWAPTGLSVRAYVGAFATTASGRSGSFETWCIDIFQETYLGEAVKDYHGESGSTVPGVVTKAGLERLATEALAQVGDARTSAAFQLAAWEIVNETASTWDLSGGNFTVSGASDSSVALATTWLNGLPAAGTPSAYDMAVLASPTRQDLVYFTKVPEPSTLAVLGAGLLGFVASRRKTRL